MDTPYSIVDTRRARGATKLLLEFSDGARIETVAIVMRDREGDGSKTRTTLCLSSQVGCRMGCVFCATGRMGLRRNLAAGEIVAQIAAARSVGLRPDHLVFMGMGEPLDNYDAVAGAIRHLVDSRARDGLPPSAYSARQITVSTCGLVPGIDRLATLGLNKLTLAVSINAPDDALRSTLMPVNRAHPLDELRAAIERYGPRGGTFLAEYVVFEGLNDSRSHARALAAYLAPFRACVNLIAYNPGTANDMEYATPSVERVEQFKCWLNEAGQYARRRESRGASISAGCGQLATDSQ